MVEEKETGKGKRKGTKEVKEQEQQQQEQQKQQAKERQEKEKKNKKEQKQNKKVQQQQVEVKKDKSKEKKYAVILVRGRVNMDHQRKKTLDLLGLYRKNYCVIVPANPVYEGMLRKVKDYVTWGEISQEVEELLVKKKQEFDKRKNRPKKFFRLAPPIGGFERKGIKKPYSVGGALGYRGEAINDLIKRMLR